MYNFQHNSKEEDFILHILLGVGVKQLFLSYFAGCLLGTFIVFDVNAAVLQSAKDALTNDIFVSGPKHSAKAKNSSKVRHNVNVNKSNTISSTKTEENNSPKNEDDTVSSSEEKIEENKPQNPHAGYGYTKKYASKLFKSYSGYITIEQKNIPSRIGVTKGSTIQINLQETPDTIWNIELDEKIGKITLNKVNGNQRTLVIQAVNSGSTRLFLDNISIKDNNYRVIFSKKMSLMVDE